MGVHEFTLVVSGPDDLTAEVVNALYEAGCDDGTPGMRNGAFFVAFDREAPSLPDAILSAIRDVEGAGHGLRVVRIEADDLIPAAEIGRRLGRSKEAIRLYASGKRGPGGFPEPAAGVRGKTPLYHWPDVARWAASTSLFPPECVPVESGAVEFFNAALGVRKYCRVVPRWAEALALLGIDSAEDEH